MLPQVRKRLSRAIEYHEDCARQIGGDDHLEKYRARREGQQDDKPKRARKADSTDESKDEAPQAETQRQDPDEYWADTHADAARQLRELLASQPSEPAIHSARRERAEAGILNRMFRR